MGDWVELKWIDSNGNQLSTMSENSMFRKIGNINTEGRGGILVTNSSIFYNNLFTTPIFYESFRFLPLWKLVYLVQLII